MPETLMVGEEEEADPVEFAAPGVGVAASHVPSDWR